MNQSIPAITVLMPLYNAEEFLREAIDSILGQTFSDFELLIIDDSTDRSYEVAKSYSDPRIRIIKNDPPLGLRKSSNIGIREAKGKYIARMEADDISLPGRLEKQFLFMETHPDVSVSGCYLSAFGNEQGVWKYPLEDAEIKAGLIWGITIAHPTSFMRKDFLLNKNFFYKEEGLPYAEDWEFFYNMRRMARFHNLGEVLYRYRRSGGSVTKRMKPEREKIMHAMFTRVLTDMGIRFSEEELKLHRIFAGDFFMDADLSTIRKAKQWMGRLIAHNTGSGSYPQDAFKRICAGKWNALFYSVVPYGRRAVLEYFKYSDKVSSGQVVYFLKSAVNKWVGRSPKTK